MRSTPPDKVAEAASRIEGSDRGTVPKLDAATLRLRYPNRFQSPFLHHPIVTLVLPDYGPLVVPGSFEALAAILVCDPPVSLPHVVELPKHGRVVICRHLAR